MGEAGALTADVGEATAHRSRVRALNLRGLTTKLYAKACKWGLRHETAEDLVHTALVALASPPAPPPPPCWDHVADPTAWIFTIRAMEDQLSADRKKAKRRRTDLDSEAIEEVPPSSDRYREERFFDREDADILGRKLLEKLAHAPNALAVAKLCMTEYEMPPRQIAVRLGWEVSRVYEATRVVRAAAKELAREEAQVGAPELADA